MVTTIQLNENVKKILDKLKTGRETYEDVILKMMTNLEEQKREQEKLLIEGCKEMAGENLKITREFEEIEDLSQWKW